MNLQQKSILIHAIVINPTQVKCDDEFTCIPPEYICDGSKYQFK